MRTEPHKSKTVTPLRFGEVRVLKIVVFGVKSPYATHLQLWGLTKNTPGLSTTRIRLASMDEVISLVLSRPDNGFPTQQNNEQHE